MPELPEIYCRAREMNEHLTGRTIRSIEVLQPKCLNVAVETFEAGLAGAEIKGTTYHGKWLLTDTSQGHLLINLGMGGELALVDPEAMPEKWRVRFDFKDGKTFAVNFWWFGNTHFAEPGKLPEHTMKVVKQVFIYSLAYCANMSWATDRVWWRCCSVW